MAGEQWEVRFLGQSAFIAAYQRQNFVVTAQVVIVITQVNRGITVMRQFYGCYFAQLGGFSVTAFQEKIALRLTNHARIVLHGAGSARDPLSSQINFSRFNGGVGAAGYDL